MGFYENFHKIKDSVRRNRTIELTEREPAGIPIPLGGETAAHLRFGNAQHIGAREQQQDSFGYSNLRDAAQIVQKGVLAVLADGMGGLQNGKQVSDYVVSAALSMFQGLQSGANIPEQLKQMVIKINQAVCESYGTGAAEQVGSTLSALLIQKTKLYWISVGDSHAYVYRKGALYQFNEDHNYLNRLLNEYMHDEISLEQARNDPQKAALTSYIGHTGLPYIDFNRRGFAIQRGDIFILCSDGVYNALNNAELIEALQYEPQKAAHMVVKAVLAKRIKGQDNMTVMVIEYK